MKLSVAVMAHRQRKRYVEKLLPRLGRVPVIWDEKNDVWDTGRRALLAYQPEATHHLVIQDDAVAPRHLLVACRNLLAHVPPDAPVSLYMGRWRHTPQRFAMSAVVTAAQSAGASFAVFPGPWWGVGIIVPTADVKAIVAYGDENPKDQPNYDLRIAQFYDGKGVECYYTMPSLVDHQPGPSLIGRRGARRHAAWRADLPLTRLDWSGGVIRPAKTIKRFPRTP